MEDLVRCIHFWEVIHDAQGALLSPSTLCMVEKTIRFLEELKGFHVLSCPKAVEQVLDEVKCSGSMFEESEVG